MIYLAGIDGLTIKITQQASAVLEFKSDHEEADNKMFAYGKYIATEHPIKKMIITFPDSDVSVISCFQKISCLESIDEIWLKSGIGVNIRYLPIHDINDQLGFSVVELLSAVHSITGCESVSSLFGIGKKNAFETLKANSESLTDMRLFGDSPSLSVADYHVTACIKFVCSLYDKLHKNTTSIICDTNYSLKKTYRRKATTKTRFLIIPPSPSKLSMLCLEKCLCTDFGTTQSCWEWMGEERRNTGARKSSSKCCTKSHC